MKLFFTSAMISGGNVQWLWYLRFAHIACGGIIVTGIFHQKAKKHHVKVTCNHML
jgi:hypothetical protein